MAVESNSTRDQPSSVLIVIEEAVVAVDLEGLMRMAGHAPRIAASFSDAMKIIAEEPPDLIITEMSVTKDSSAHHAFEDLILRQIIPAIFINAVPRRLLGEDGALPGIKIEKPFRPDAVLAATSEALKLRGSKRPMEEINSDPDLQSRPGPVNAEVVGGQLKLRWGNAGITELPVVQLETLRRQSLSDARRLLAELQGSNAGPAFTSRIEALAVTLEAPLTDATLLLASQAHSLERMLPVAQEALSDVVAQDVTVFVQNLSLLVRQFPAWRQFLMEAETTRPLSTSDTATLMAVADVLERDIGELIEPELRKALIETRLAREGLLDGVLDLAWMRTLNNALLAMARWVRRVGKIAADEYTKALGKDLGTALSKATVSTLLGTCVAVASGLAGLPEFAWLAGFTTFAIAQAKR